MLNWTEYDAHDWAECEQEIISAAGKRDLENFAADLLNLTPNNRSGCWGKVCPPGRNALAIKIAPDVHHRFAKRDISMGLKIFNLLDGKIMWPSVSRFHNEQRNRVAGLPNAHVQEVFHCATARHDGLERGYLVFGWTEGQTLKSWMTSPVTADDAVQVLDDLFLELIIPLWSVGTSWWDVRPCNYVVTPKSRLIMIDSDTIGGYANEIVNTPHQFDERNHGTITAFKRYRTIIAALAVAVTGPNARGKRGKIEKTAKDLFNHHLGSLITSPYPLPEGWIKTTTCAYRAFRSDFLGLVDQKKF